jgi:hypothetical protein
MKLYKFPLTGVTAAAWLLGSLMTFALVQAQAQSLRDPTMPPAGAVLAVPDPVADASASIVESGGRAVIVRSGKPYLVVGSRLYAQGQKMEQTRIERITETELWLREGSELKKVPQFLGVERRVLTPLVKK